MLKKRIAETSARKKERLKRPRNKVSENIFILCIKKLPHSAACRLHRIINASAVSMEIEETSDYIFNLQFKVECLSNYVNICGNFRAS